MSKTMERTFIQSGAIHLSSNLNFKELSEEQLIDTVVIQEETADAYKSKEELINRGKNEVSKRIIIKKLCKHLILESENRLKENASTDLSSKEAIKMQKKRFLTLLSLSDRLQLEWQKYDLALRH